MRDKLKILLLDYLLIAIAFVALNRQIPKVIDDYPYSRSFVGVSSPAEDQDINNTITSLSELFDSQVAHYQAINGRAIVHTIVQAFCCFWEKLPFDILQGIMIILWLVFASRLIECRNKEGRLYPTGIMALLLMLALFRDPSAIYHGIACSVNYLWVSTLAMAFLWMFTRKETTSPYIIYVLAFLTGWSNEAFTLPITAALVVYALLRHKKMNTMRWVALGLLIMGACLMVMAPANFNRLATAQSESNADSLLMYHLVGLKAFRIVFLWIMAVVIGLLLHKIKLREYIQENSLFIMIIVFSVLMSLAIGGDNLRQGVMGELTAALLITKLLLKNEKYGVTNAVCRIMEIVAIFVFIGITSLQIPATERFNAVDKEVALSKQDTCIVMIDNERPLPVQVTKYLAAELSDFQIDQFRWWYSKDTVIIRNKENEIQ